MLVTICAKSPYAYRNHYTSMVPHTCIVIFFDAIQVSLNIGPHTGTVGFNLFHLLQLFYSPGIYRTLILQKLPTVVIDVIDTRRHTLAVNTTTRQNNLYHGESLLTTPPPPPDIIISQRHRVSYMLSITYIIKLCSYVFEIFKTFPN